MSLGTHPVVDADVERSFDCAGPFVINLHASVAPIGLPAKVPACNEHARLYQIQRVDDGRIRYRLRLGPFPTEQEADTILAQVRLEYPGALMAIAAADDLHAIAVARGKANSAGLPADTHGAEVSRSIAEVRPVAAASAPAPVAQVVAVAHVPPPTEPVPVLTLAVAMPAPILSAPPAVAARALAVTAQAPLTVAAQAPVVTAQAPLTLAAQAPVVTARRAVAAPAPAVGARGPAASAPLPQVSAPRTSPDSVAAEFASMQALIASIDSHPAAAAVANKTAKPHVLHSVPAAKPPVRRDGGARGDVPVPSLESTQTLRPLTPLELGEHEAPRWFVVQLALSDDAFDPDSLPHLDIFSLYRLYTVIGMDQGRLVHALRLGFFGEEVGARAVASYLAAFYDEPIVKRVSVAERDRFADQSVEARKDVGATGRHLVIEITDELVVRGRRSSR